jgi:thiamine-monophosphate kinase
VTVRNPTESERAARTPSEFERIERFFAPLAGSGALGLKDDAALLDPIPGRRFVLTADAIVAGVHYLPDDPPDLVARKLLRVNLSDLAAMGATPEGYLLTTALPPDHGADWLERFAAGLAADQAEFGIVLLGGDSVATPGPATFSLTAVGSVEVGRELRRGGARPGDHIYVSGTLGDGALGLRALRGELPPSLGRGERDALADRYRLPRPRLALGRGLAGDPATAPLAHAAMDISDGLVADLAHICAASGVAATVRADRLPLSPAARAAVEADPALLALPLAGGDDYELLFTAPPAAAAALAVLAAELDLPLTRIGEIPASGPPHAATDRAVRVVDGGGHELSLSQQGYRHF